VYWIPLGVLIGGVVLAAVIFGFGAYEINWKKTRLQSDIARLDQLNQQLVGLQSDLSRAQTRMVEAQQSIADGRQS